jgi:hypothetical protein
MKRQAILAAGLTGAAAVFGEASAVRADDAGMAVLQKINAAQSALTSFVTTMTASSSGVASVATFVRKTPKTPGDRFSGIAEKIETSAGTLTIDSYVIDSTLYLSVNGSPWQKKPLNTEQFKMFAGSLIDGFKANPPVATLQPDRVDAGVTYGDLRIVSATPPALASLAPAVTKTMTIECMYDKTTYLMHECDADQFSIVYSKVNDPSNSVELPLAAATATTLTMPLPGESPAAAAPAASAPPAH